MGVFQLQVHSTLHPHLTLPPSKGEEVYDRDSLKANDFTEQTLTPMTDEREFYLFSADYLKDFSAKVFMHFGISEADAIQAAEVLAKSDLRGIDSHGVARLHTYFDMLELGRINPKPNIKNRPRKSQRGNCRWRQWFGARRRPEGE